jgi:lipid II:glycine glycyltransferase (peptidoglycan interpeptide bridge formation enzyme)
VSIASIRLLRPVPATAVVVTERPSPAALAAWVRLVAETPGSDVAQLPGWATLRGTVGFSARYVFVYAREAGHGYDFENDRDGFDPDVDGELVGGAQVLERPLPALGRVGYIPYGPLISGSLSGRPAVRAAVVEALAGALSGLGRSRVRMLFVQPPPGAESISGALLERGFRTSDAGITPTHSLRLDLSLDRAALRARLSKRLRTWTNRWESRGVRVRTATEADLPTLARLIAQSGEHQGFAAADVGYLRTLLTDLPGSVGFIGELDGAPVAAAVFTRCADTLKLRFAGMDRDDAVARSNVPAAVQWHAIGWARAAGLRWFDFGGISADAARRLAEDGRRDALRGVDRFKAGFGGEPYAYPSAVELIASALPRIGYDLSRRWTVGRKAIELAKRALRTGRLGRGGEPASGPATRTTARATAAPKATEIAIAGAN